MTTQHYSTTWSQVTARYGRSMRDILLTLYMTHGTSRKMARELGVSADTVRDWWSICQLPEFGKQDDGSVTIVVCGEVN